MRGVLEDLVLLIFVIQVLEFIVLCRRVLIVVLEIACVGLFLLSLGELQARVLAEHNALEVIVVS